LAANVAAVCPETPPPSTTNLAILSPSKFAFVVVCKKILS
jgi:hypothetical protein